MNRRVVSAQVLKSVDMKATKLDVVEVAIHSDLEHEAISVYMAAQVRA